MNNDIFLTVADDGNLSIWDTRAGTVQSQVKVSDREVYCLAVNPRNSNLVLTAGEDCNVKLWDARNYNNKLYHF